MEENRVLLRGQVAAPAQFSHEAHGLRFYRFPFAVARLSGRADTLDVLLPASAKHAALPQEGERLEIGGEVRSFNNRSGVGRKLVITVLARTLVPTDDPEPCNRVLLAGALCKPPVLRTTPLGREICDLLLAVERRYGRSDYLPCIAWGPVARRCAALDVGAPLRFEGRLQSRVYTKRLGETAEERTAFEISVMQLLDP